jgi:2-keto-3-deoxy-L-rhamnonate aldolase RhmA
MRNHLTALLEELKSQHGLLSLKAGTEWEDMNYEEIEHLHALGQGALPILVKIAGPEAKTDLRHLREIGVDGILGPMIESEYALEKFVLTAQEAYADSRIDPLLAINVETIQGYEQLSSLMASSYFQAVDTVVIGRLDLSLSMRMSDVDHPHVTEVTQDLARRVRQAGKHVSVGGFVNPDSAGSLRENGADRMNTIHTLFDFNKVTDPAVSIWKAIEFEMAYYQSLISLNPVREAFYRQRIEVSQAKLDKAARLMQTPESAVAA